jgi:hypothetical protein
VPPRPAGTGIVGFAGIAQLVERNLAKVEVAGSNPVARLDEDANWWSSRTFGCAAYKASGARLDEQPDRGAVAQLARALRSHRRSRGFKSLPPHLK